MGETLIKLLDGTVKQCTVKTGFITHEWYSLFLKMVNGMVKKNAIVPIDRHVAQVVFQIHPFRKIFWY